MKKFISLTLMGLMTLSLASCSIFEKFQKNSSSSSPTTVDDGLIHVTFDTNTTLKTNNIKEQVFTEAGHKLKEPVLVITSDNPENLELYGWYREKTFVTKWNFDTDLVQESMTLYARYLSQRTVNYYQGLDENHMNLIGTETVFDGEAIPEREDLPDCYENQGFYHLSNVNKNSDGTYSGVKTGLVDLENDVVTATTDVLYQRSENIYFHADSIKRRFVPIAANEGNDGSTPGTIETVVDENTGEKYSKINFGWAKTIGDPRILMDNPRIDVTKSQSLQITMKNIGPARSLSFYWIGKWSNGNWINDKEYHSFNEESRYTFSNGTQYQKDTANTCYHDENGQTYQFNQKETDDWVTYTIPIYKKLSMGVSSWGNAQWITAFVIQSTYSNKDNDDNKNTLLIKEIKGVSNSDAKGFNDSSDVETLKHNDSNENLTSAGNAQEAVNGFIFPKNNSCITNTVNSTIYKKTDGIYIHGNYFSGKQTIRFAADKDISLDGFTTFKFKYRNYSYVSKVTFMFGVEYVNEKGSKIESSVPLDYVLSSRMGEAQEAKVNMFGTPRFQGKLKYIDLSYSPVGIDNMLMLSYLKFDAYEAKKVVGVNFDDLYCGNVTTTGDVTATYDSIHGGTKVSVNGSNAKITKTFAQFDDGAYKSMVLSLTNNASTVTKITINAIHSGVSTSYVVDTSAISGSRNVELELTEVGKLDALEFVFEGTGDIYLHSLSFKMNETSIDYSTGEYAKVESVYKNDFNGFTYDSLEIAMMTTKLNSSETCSIWSRLGVRSDLKLDGKRVYNMSLAGKSKIAVVYQNRSSKDSMGIAFAAVLKSEHLTNNDYLTMTNAPSASVTINGVTKAPGYPEIKGIKTNMKEGEWAVAYLDIDSFYTSSENECYVTTVVLSSPVNLNGSMYFRGFSII